MAGEFVTLTQVAQRYYDSGNIDAARIIYQHFVAGSPLLGALSFKTMPGSHEITASVGEYGDVGTRALNAGRAASPTTSLERFFPKAILGGDVKVDHIAIKRYGASEIDFQRESKLNAIRSHFEKLAIKGDPVTNPLEFRGLQSMTENLGEDQLIPAGSSADGDPLNLSLMDEAFQKCANPTHWVMSLAMYLRLTKAARNSSQIDIVKDDYGKPQMYYSGLPVVALFKDLKDNSLILPFTETPPGGGSAESTSVYCLSVRPGGIYGVQTSDIDVYIDDSHLENGLRTAYMNVDWDVSLAIGQPQSLVRIWGIIDAPIVDT